MLWTSIVKYTFKGANGEFENFASLDEVKGIALSDRKVSLTFGGNDKGDKFIVPIIYGYKKPYVYEKTDNIGTEHIIIYKEDNFKANTKLLRKDPLSKSLILYSQNDVSINDILKFSDIVDKDSCLTVKSLLDEWEKYHLEFNK